MRAATLAAQPPANPRGESDSPGKPAGLEAANSEEARAWIRVCRIDDIPRLGARLIRRPYGANVALFRTATDAFFALEDRCPHRGGPLSQGIVFGERVACPLHNTNVELRSGCAVAPDKGRVVTFEVKVEGDFIYVALPPNVTENG
jgi:nitrite reductase [NAD(P)H] small subunit